MSNKYRIVGLIVATLIACACTDQPAAVNRVQTNLVDKSIFDGEWWFSSTSIDVKYDQAFVFNSANALAPFSGSMSTDYALDYNRSGTQVLGDPSYSFPIARIRWVIDEKYLFAYRANELVAGGNLDGRSPDFRGEPLAVFEIEDHVDVKKEYSTVTGEKTNVTAENTEDRRWYDRKFMRVDWSKNLLTQFSANDVEANELFTSFKREDMPFFIQGGAHGDYPKSYEPQFIRVKDDPDYARTEEWPDNQRDSVHYMSFVTQEMWSPKDGCVQGNGVCASVTSTTRNSFLRIPPEHEYAAHTRTNAEFDRFGIFRSHQPTYARGGEDKSVQRKHCDVDNDCGPQGACDNADRRASECTAAGKAANCRSEENICVGGLTSDLGMTDFLSFYSSRLNFFQNSLTDQTCAEDWECDGRYLECAQGDDDCVANQGSVCDPAARRCTTPLSKRTLKPVAFHLSPHFPPYLVRQAFEAVADWNEAMMRAQRASSALLPFDQENCQTGSGVCTTDLSKNGRVSCQRENPTAYCYCGSPNDQGGTCRQEYDAFESPDAAAARGVPNPYDCYVVGPDDLSHPKDFADYNNADFYSYEFVGSECMLVAKSNSCDLDPSKPCEDLGDLRYHFLTHLQQGGANFGGIAQPLSDPTSGELITTSATIAAESLENVGTLASQFFPVLRGDQPEDSYFTGENLRGYFASLGKVEHPVATVPASSAGYTSDDASRPDRSEDARADAPASMKNRFEAAFAKAERLKGQDGRAAVFSDRKAALRGTNIDAQLGAALGAELPDSTSPAQAVAAQLGSAKVTPTKPLMVASIDAAQRELDLERQRQIAMGTRNMDSFQDQLFNSQYWRYFADKFKDVSLAEASLRMQQGQFKAIALHEIGHVLGLRHNFGGSLDRNNYPDGYFAVAKQTPLPHYSEYDDPAHGGNGDRRVTGNEVERFERELRAAREERLTAGAGTVMTASIMDYNGDLSDYAGLGRYDKAAVMYSYFDKVEAYNTGDPTADPSMNPATMPRAFVGLERPDIHRRELWSYYRGGDSCAADVDCPYSAGRDATSLQPITQRCIPNPRLPVAANATCGKSATSASCICSNFYDDFDAYVSGDAYRNRARETQFAPVKYLFCHDNRVSDLSWCTRSDAGESFQEVIEHYRRSWRERYPRAYFRNFRADGPARGAAYGNVVDAVKIYQHMFFRRSFEGADYVNNPAPLGFDDQLNASSGALDWLNEIIGTPDVGSYKLDPTENIYRKLGAAPDADGSDLSLSIGQGFFLWSEYQTGLNGYFRLERAGTFLDKLLAIQAITKRDWGLTYQVDEFYYVNFFDLFEKEVVDMFGGLIMRNPRAYAPRVSSEGTDGGVVKYVSTYRADNRPNQDVTYPEPAIDGSDTETLRDIATIEALSEFPVYYDTSFEQRMLVFKLGSGDGYKVPEKRRDGTPTCKYLDQGCDKPDYIVYDSDRLHTSYVAVVIDPEETGVIDEQQVAYTMLKRLSDRQTRIRDLAQKADLTADEADESTRLKSELQRDESYIEYLIELERQLGISSYFF